MTQQPGPGQPPPAYPAASPEQTYAPGTVPPNPAGQTWPPAAVPSNPPGQYPPGVPYAQAAVPPPPPEGRWRPARVDPLPGTGFGLVQLEVVPAPSGLATGALIAGIASIGVSVLVLCFGVAGAEEGWGGWVAGAFTVLAVLAGGGAVAAGLAARRQIRRSGEPGRLRFTGRGTAVAGISCGASGAGIALLALALGLMLQL
jgi:hypothetical protein